MDSNAAKAAARCAVAGPGEPGPRPPQSQRLHHHSLGEASMSEPCACHHPTPNLSRRAFLADLGLGFTGLVLGAMLHRDGFASEAQPWAPPDGKPHFRPKAKSVIWLFMNGGVSHVESFDPKPMLTKYAGKTIAETPFKEA